MAIPQLDVLVGPFFRSGRSGRDIWLQCADSDAYFSLTGEVINVKALGAIGDGITRDDRAFQAAIDAVPSTGGYILIPPGTYRLALPLTITKNNVAIVGMGRCSTILMTGTGNLFNVSGQDFFLDNIGITITTTATRAGSVIINPTALLGKVRNVTVSGSVTFNNGGFAGHLTASGSEWTYEHIRFIAGTTWEYLFKTKSTAGTMAGITINDLVVFSTTFTDAGLIFDSFTDTAKVSQAQIAGAGAAPAIHVRNSDASQAPRWIHFIDCSIETASLGPCLKMDDGRDINYLGGYFATAVNAAILNGGTGISIAGTLITNILQHGIIVAAAAAGVAIVFNRFDDSAGLQTTNTYDCINLANSTINFNILGNWFRQPSANKPRYAVNISGVNCGFFVVSSNDTTTVAWGTAPINNLSTSNVQRIWNNAGIADVTKDSAGASLIGSLIVGAATPNVPASQLGLGTTTGFGNGAAGTAVTTTLKGTGSGPANPQTIVNQLKINVGGVDYWIGLTQ